MRRMSLRPHVLGSCVKESFPSASLWLASGIKNNHLCLLNDRKEHPLTALSLLSELHLSPFRSQLIRFVIFCGHGEACCEEELDQM